MARSIFPTVRIHPTIADVQSNYHKSYIDDVERAIDTHDIVVVGMAQNPFPRKARRFLQSRSLPFHYLEYGSYLSKWRERLAIKMWVGWPTFPMIFVKGTFIGGASDLVTLAESGELDRMLES